MRRRRDSGHMFFTTLKLNTALLLLGFLACSLWPAACTLHTQDGKVVHSNQIAKVAAIDCGSQVVQKLALSYVAPVALALIQPDYQSRLKMVEADLTTQGIGDGVGLLGCIMNHVLRSLPARPLGRQLVYALPGETCTPPTVGRPIADDEKICPPPEVGTQPVPPGTSNEAVVKARAELWLKMHSAPATAKTPVRGAGCSCLKDSECGNGQVCRYCNCTSSFLKPTNRSSPEGCIRGPMRVG